MLSKVITIFTVSVISTVSVACNDKVSTLGAKAKYHGASKGCCLKSIALMIEMKLLKRQN